MPIKMTEMARLELTIRHGLSLYSDLDSDEARKVAQALAEHLADSPVFTQSIQK